MMMIETIEQNELYKMILNDSHGGVIYDVANISKYNKDEAKKISEAISKLDCIDGIMGGVKHFIDNDILQGEK